MNKMLKTLIYGGQMSLAVLDTTDMVNEAIKIHALSPTAAAALGRALTACTFMCGALKSPQDKLSVTIAGGGPGGKITVCGNGELFIRGSIDEPSADLPLKANGKLDVGGLVGREGRLTVVRSMGLKEPWSGSSPLVSGEIAEDFAAYYAFSEQQPTAIALGVKIGKDGTCLAAGGAVVQAMPGAEEQNLSEAENKVKSMGNISSLIEEDGAEGVMKRFFGAEEYNEYHPQYKCLCSREYVAGLLVSLGKAELEDIVEKEGSVKVGCQFCRKTYEFTAKDVGELFEKYGE